MVDHRLYSRMMKMDHEGDFQPREDHREFGLVEIQSWSILIQRNEDEEENEIIVMKFVVDIATSSMFKFFLSFYKRTNLHTA